MNPKLLLSILLSILISSQFYNCKTEIDSTIKKAQKICDTKFLRDILLPGTTELLSSLVSGGANSTSSTTDPINIDYGSEKTSFVNPKFLTKLNSTSSTISGKILDKDEIQVWGFKGTSMVETWKVELISSDNNLSCKSGALYSVTSLTSIDDTYLSPLSTSLYAASSVITYIACTSKYNSKLPNPDTLTGAFNSISYTIKLSMDNTSSASNTTQSLVEANKKLKYDTAIFNWSNCRSDAEIPNTIKGLVF